LSLTAFAGATFIRLLHATLRVRHIRVQKMARVPQYIIAFWHRHLLLMLHARYRRPISVIISRSRDGEMIARVFDWYGVESARGSTTRGGSAALREMIRVAAAGKNIVFTPDGPKGPPCVAKDGVVWAARATGLPIVPIAFAAKKKSCCAPGTEWSSPIRSHARSFSTATPSSCPATATSRTGEGEWNEP
jgi:lysophospholipid acyltransferase (LPLAT)-like uncharacterized protein